MYVWYCLNNIFKTSSSGYNSDNVSVLNSKNIFKCQRMFLLVSWHWTGVLLLQINASNDFIELEKYSFNFFATSVFDENFPNLDIVRYMYYKLLQLYRPTVLWVYIILIKVKKKNSVRLFLKSFFFLHFMIWSKFSTLCKKCKKKLS